MVYVSIYADYYSTCMGCTYDGTKLHTQVHYHICQQDYGLSISVLLLFFSKYYYRMQYMITFQTHVWIFGRICCVILLPCSKIWIGDAGIVIIELNMYDKILRNCLRGPYVNLQYRPARGYRSVTRNHAHLSYLETICFLDIN